MSTREGESPRPRVARRRWLWVAVLLAVGAGTVLVYSRNWRRDQAYAAPTPSFDGPSSALTRTVVVPTLDTPMPSGRNVIWCSSFKIAWDHLCSDIVGEPIQLDRSQALAQSLNQAPGWEKDLPPAYVYTASGRAGDVIVKVTAELPQRFPGARVPAFSKPEAMALMAFAYLKAAAEFKKPYFLRGGVERFRDSAGVETPVRTFGFADRPGMTYVNHQLSEQAQLLYCKTDHRDMRTEEFALDLCRQSPEFQVMVAVIVPAATLAETLADLERKIEAGSTTDSFDDLAVPEICFRIDHVFRELKSALLTNPKWQGWWIDEARQRIDFRLDRCGAAVESSAHIVAAKKAAPPQLLCLRPFLIVMSKRGAPHPFFVMWVDNAELLQTGRG